MNLTEPQIALLRSLKGCRQRINVYISNGWEDWKYYDFIDVDSAVDFVRDYLNIENYPVVVGLNEQNQINIIVGG